MLTVTTLGRLEFSEGERRLPSSGDREAALLVYVAHEWPRPVMRERLAEAFWANSSDQHGLHSVSQAFYRLSSRFPGLAFSIQGREVTVEPHVVSLDLRDFRGLVRQGRYTEAANRYRGPFLEGFSLPRSPEFDDWLERVRADVARLAEEVFRHQLTTAEDRADWPGVERAAADLLRLDPLDQVAAASEIGAMLSRGASGEASRRYASLLRALEDAGDTPQQRVLDVGRALARATHGVHESPQHMGLPLVGRGAEFEQLKKHLTAAQQGNGGFVAITAGAGLGKTRLCEQLHRLAALRGFRTFRVACTPFASALPYSGGRQMFADITERDVAHLQSGPASSLAHVLPAACVRGPDNGRTEPPTREWFLSEAASLVASCAERSPLLLLFEDVHWIDAPSAELLRALLETARGRRILIVATARPHELARRGDAVRDVVSGASCTVVLRELACGAVDDLIRAFAEALNRQVPETVAAIVRRKSGGHPFFMLELLRAWSASSGGNLLFTDGAISDSIETFLSERFDALSDPELRATEALAVLGGSADAAVVGEVAGLGIEETANVVDELCTKGLIQDAQRGLSFLHDLVREAAYRKLRPTRRAMLHKRVVRVLRGRRGVDVGALASHSAAAGDDEAAYRLAIAAAQRSERRFGFAEAEPFWQLAVHHAHGEARTARALEGLSNCLYREVRSPEADAAYSALERIRSLNPETRLLVAARRLAVRARLQRGSATQAEDAAEMLARALNVKGEVCRIRIVEALAFVLLISDRSDLLTQQRDAVVDLLERAPALTETIFLIEHILHLSIRAGNFAEAYGYADIARRITRDGTPAQRSEAFGMIAAASLVDGRTRAAEGAFDAAASLVNGQVAQLSRSLRANWAMLCAERGEFARARELLDGVLSGGCDLTNAYQALVAESNLAWVFYEAGDYVSAEAHGRATLTVGSGPIVSVCTALSVGILGLIDLEAGGTGSEQYRRALLERQTDEMPGGVDFSYPEIFLARMSEREGRLDEALERLGQATDWYAGRDFFCHGRLALEKARLIGTRDREAGLGLAREVRARAADAEAVLLLNKAEALIRELKRAEPAGATRSKGAVALAAGQASGRRGRARSKGTG